MTIDSVRELKAWSSVLVAWCEYYVAAPSPYRSSMLMEVIRNLALAMDKALEEELSKPSEEKALP